MVDSTPECFAKLTKRWEARKLLCVGLDSDYARLPEAVRSAHASREEALFAFNRSIIDATAEHACAFKPNSAFYEAEGAEGIRALKRTSAYLKDAYPDIPVILDAKRGDIGTTSEAYARAVFDELGVDAITVNPYLGKDALRPFLDRSDKGIFVLVKTSNPGAGEFQDVRVGEREEPLYAMVARHVAAEWNEHGNCGVVVGATYPEELKVAREIIGEMPILVPGVGAQEGDVAKTIAAGRGKTSFGLIVNLSRSVIFASSGEDFAAAAEAAAAALSREIQNALEREGQT